MLIRYGESTDKQAKMFVIVLCWCYVQRKMNAILVEPRMTSAESQFNGR